MTVFKRSPFKNCQAGKVLEVKNLLRYFLMMVFVLMAGSANAHGVMDTAPVAAHGHSHIQNNHHTHQYALPDAQHLLAAADSVAPVEAHHIDTCSHSHCGHNHAAGLMEMHSAYMTAGAAIAVPTSSASWASSAITDNIERPKWLFTTPAVVSLLT